ncbi:MAG TPA: monofunctional biosynthetic peptidoglycan transglycosylase [Pedomonas sp.]|uniref:monofunctional biosynthetic peptidoglycan transglycosylase n=1 Tax=Pedomonas sp. TaxID=2976421 RepID=UPI002F4179FB
MLARLVSWVIKALLAVLLFTVVWALAYRWINPPATSLMVRDWAAGKTVQRNWMPIETMSPRIAHAVMAAEDQHFCAHKGFDFKAISKAMESNRNGRKLRGASTISQQVAKNVFLWPQRSWVRKGFEAWFTLLIEVLWPKQRTLEVYLNVAEWGDGIYGADAAARHHFGRSAADLSRSQAARLASILPSPVKWSPHRTSGGIARKARSVERSMSFIRREMSGCLDLR